MRGWIPCSFDHSGLSVLKTLETRTPPAHGIATHIQLIDDFHHLLRLIGMAQNEVQDLCEIQRNQARLSSIHAFDSILLPLFFLADDDYQVTDVLLQEHIIMNRKHWIWRNRLSQLQDPQKLRIRSCVRHQFWDAHDLRYQRKGKQS